MEALQTMTPEQSEEVLVIMTRECRDLLDLLQAKGYVTGISSSEFNQIVRDHFAMDNSGYGITVEEWLPGIDEEKRVEVVNEVLAKPEYND